MHFIFKVSLSVSAASQSKLGALDLDWVYSTAWPWALIETGFTPDDSLPRDVRFRKFKLVSMQMIRLFSAFSFLSWFVTSSHCTFKQH